MIRYHHRGEARAGREASEGESGSWLSVRMSRQKLEIPAPSNETKTTHYKLAAWTMLWHGK
jgi:hypothetical protein